MNLEDYFDFLPGGGIRIKGHRIDLEQVIREYKSGKSIDQLLEDFDTLDATELKACVDYYLKHRREVDEIIYRLDEKEDQAYKEQQTNLRIVDLKKRFEEYSQKKFVLPGIDKFSVEAIKLKSNYRK